MLTLRLVITSKHAIQPKDHSAIVSAAVAAAHCYSPASRVVDVHILPGRLDRAQKDFQSSSVASLVVVQAVEAAERNREVDIGLAVGIEDGSVGRSLDRMITVSVEERRESDRDMPWGCRGLPLTVQHRKVKDFDLRPD